MNSQAYAGFWKAAGAFLALAVNPLPSRSCPKRMTLVLVPLSMGSTIIQLMALPSEVT